MTEDANKTHLEQQIKNLPEETKLLANEILALFESSGEDFPENLEELLKKARVIKADPVDSKPHGMNRRRFCSTIFKWAGAGTIATAGNHFGADMITRFFTDAKNNTKEFTDTTLNPLIAEAAGLENGTLKTIDILATSDFFLKVMRLSTGKDNGINTGDYARAIGFNVARCLAGGKEVTDHTLHELSFGFESAAKAVFIGMALEGISARVPQILKTFLKQDASQPERVAAITMMASVISPIGMTISSSSALGKEIRSLCWDKGADKTNERAMSVLMGHTGDHSALASLFYADPPDIPFFKMVGWKTGVALKTVYGLPPAIYSLFSANVKANYALNGNHMGKAVADSMAGMRSILPILPVFMAQSLTNLTCEPRGVAPDRRGLVTAIIPRMQEALNNFTEIAFKEDPRCRHRFAHHHGYVSELMQLLTEQMSTYTAGKLDPDVAKLEGILDAVAEDYEDQLTHLSAVRDLWKKAMTSKNRDISKACFVAASQEVDTLFPADKAPQMKAYLSMMWHTVDELHYHEQNGFELATPRHVLKVMARLTDKERLTNAFGHEQMEVMTLLPWQIFMSVPASANLEWGLNAMDKSSASPMMAGLVNMGATGVVTSFVDNLAAFLASANASIRSGTPRLMQALMSSIAFGSATWAGNPIPHGKISSGAKKPGATGPDATLYGLEESTSLGNVIMNADVYAATMAWTLYMDSKGTEERIFKEHGKIHPAFKEREIHGDHGIKETGSNDNDNHAAISVSRRSFLQI